MADDNYAIKVSFEGIEKAIADFQNLQSAVAGIKAPVLNLGGDEAAKIAEASLKKLQLEIDALESKKAASAANDALRAEQIAAKQEQFAQREAQRDADTIARKEQTNQKIIDQLERQYATANVRATQGGNEGPDKDAKFTAQTLQEALRYKQQLAAIDKAGFSPADAENAKQFAAGVNSLNLQKIEQDFARVNTGQRNFTGNLRDAAEQLSNFAAKINEVKAIAVDYAKEFNKAGRQLSTRSDNSSELIAGLKGLGSELKSQVATVDLVKNAYDNLPANFLKTADAVKISSAAAKLAQGTSSDLGGTTKGLSQLLVAYGADASQASSFADKLAFANKATGESTDVLASQLARLTPAAKAAGLGFDELNALLIQSTNQGIPARQALSAIEGSLKQITTDTARQEFARLGIAFDENILKQKGYVGLLKQVNGSQNLAADSITKIFGEQAKLNKIIPAGADGFLKLDQALQGSIKSNGLAATQFDKTATAGKAVAVSVEEAFTTLGQAVLRVGNPVLQGTKAIADAFIALPTPIQNVIGALVGGVGVFLSVSAALTGILAVVTPTIGAFKILGSTFAAVGAASLGSLSPVSGLAGAFVDVDGKATKLAGQLKTLGGAIATAALAYIAFEGVKSIFDTVSTATNGVSESTKKLKSEYEDYLRVLKEPVPEIASPQGKNFKAEFQDKLDVFQKGGDAINDTFNNVFRQREGDIFYTRTNKDVKSEQSSIQFQEQLSQSNKLADAVQGTQLRAQSGEKFTQKQLDETSKKIQANISSIQNYEAIGDGQKSAKAIQLTYLEKQLEVQNKLTSAKTVETATIEKAAVATKKQVEDAKRISSDDNADSERSTKRTFDDGKTARNLESANQVKALEERNGIAKGELDRRQASVTEALKERQTLALQDKQRAFDDAQNTKKSQREEELDAKKRANDLKQQAAQKAFDDSQNKVKEERANKQRQDDEKFANARSERDKKNGEASSGAKQLISDESKIASAKPEEKAKIAKEIQDDQRIRNEAKSQGTGGEQTQEQLIAKAKQIAQVQGLATKEEQTKVALALDELDKANKAKQSELDKIEDKKRTEDKRASDKAFDELQKAEKLAFDVVQKAETLAFEQTVLKPEKLKLEKELQADKLLFERGELATFKKQQAAEEKALKLQQETEDRALKKAADLEVEALKKKQKESELAIDRAFEDAKIERDRTFKELQRALDKTNALEIQQILGQSAKQIVDAIALAKGGTALSAAVGIGKVPAFARGVTDFVGGAALVGEEGAELVTLPRGSNVIPANQTNRILNSNSGGNKSYTINVQTGSGDGVAIATQIQRELARAAALSSGI